MEYLVDKVEYPSGEVQVEERWMITLLMVVMIYQVVVQLDHSAGAFGSGGSAGVRDFTGGAGTHGVVVVENYA